MKKMQQNNGSYALWCTSSPGHATEECWWQT